MDGAVEVGAMRAVQLPLTGGLTRDRYVPMSVGGYSGSMRGVLRESTMLGRAQLKSSFVLQRMAHSDEYCTLID